MIRKIYLDMLRRKLAAADITWLSRAAARYPLIVLSSLLRRPLCGPVLASLVVTYRCDYGCAMCGMYSRSHDRSRAEHSEYDTGKMIRIIDEFGRLGTLGLGFTGGEPTVREDLGVLLKHSVNTGMLTHLNTNGSRIDPGTAREVVKTGLDSVNISIDGASPHTHDRIRGVDGAWDRATQAVRAFAGARSARAKPRIKLVTVVMGGNLHEMPQMVDLCADLGADCLEYVPVQPFSPCSGPEENLVTGADSHEVASVLDEARARALGKTVIENSPRMMALFGPSFSGDPSPVRCYAGYNSIAVDCYGKVFPCHPWANWSRVVHDLEVSPLEEFWRSRQYDAVRHEIDQCRECTLNGQAELNLLFQPFLKIRE